MTREQFAKNIRWPIIISLIGILNSFAMFPQMWSVLTTKQVQGISVATLTMIFVIQLAFSIHGFFLRDKPLLLSNGIASLFTATTVVSTLIFRA